MPIIPYKPSFDPFQDMSELMQHRGIVPPVDMYQTKDAVVVETPLAGVDPDKVDVAVENGILTIKGSMEKKTEIDEKDYYRKEVRSGSVFRQVALPTRVVEGKAEATLVNGMLKVIIPKSHQIDAKTVKITVNKKK